MKKIKELAKKYLPKIIKDRIVECISSRRKISYAQTGEDLLIYFLIDHQKMGINKGFYVDVGALHPDAHNNTKFFYKRGWNGINIDAFPGSMKKFNEKRKRDINVEAVISDKEEERDLFIFEQKSVNTLSPALAQQYQEDGYKLEKTKKIKTQTLKGILNQKLPNGKHIDLLSIDVEGVDLEVLKSNDWGKYRPTFILIEYAEFDLDRPNDFEIYRFLKNLNYKLVAKMSVNLLFQKS